MSATNAQAFFEAKYPKSHSLPKTSIIDIMEDYWQYKKIMYEKAKKNFNSEQWQSQHNMEEIRKRFKKDE